MQNRGILMSS